MTNSCEIRGNADLFGIGVRIGSYLQWMTLIIANVAAPTRLSEVFSPIAVFQLAILVALIWNASVNSNQTYDVEAFTVTAFGVGSGLTITSIYNNKCVSRLTIGITHMLALGFYTFSVWLWSAGLKTLALSSCSWIFLFSKVHMHGRVRYFGLVISVLAAIGSMASLARLFLGLWYNRKNCRSWILKPMSEPNLSDSPKGQSKVGQYAMHAAQLFTLATLVIVVELTIWWNGIVGINDLMQTGQLIPFIAGCGVLVNIIWSCIFQKSNSTNQ